MNATVSRRPRRRRPGAAPATAALAALLLLLAGCGSDSSSTADLSHEAPEEGAAVQELTEAAPADGKAGADALEPTERAVVHTASLSVVVDDLDDATSYAKEWVEEAGGYVAAETVDSAAGQNPSAHLTLRVPADSYQEALEEFALLGNRQHLEQQAQDVTEEVADVNSRVESAEASLERLRELLEEAEEVSEILEIEEQISFRQADLEALQARQKALAEMTDYATVDLSLSLPSSTVPPVDDDSPGFFGGLAAGWGAVL
ncbi:DUF4349 domain-containing protein, partial [Thermobifida halotolerans]|uniref:DUF4349 domain-containing protein n=1 Tax=Thermobifida halotolerans TaxID=483545 RepID=UPI0018FE851A